KVLVHRIAWLIQGQSVFPSSILSVTFTNKAAQEMRGRTEAMLGMSSGGIWAGTFHGIANRLLRMHWQEADLPQNFLILDADDQHRIIRRIIKSMGLDEKKFPPKQVQWYISSCKDEGQRPQHIETLGDYHQQQMVDIYRTYEESCNKGGMVDFAELLLRAHEMLRDTPALLSHYQNRFQHILIDEFQDTNTLQYAWLRLLAGDSGRLFVVGDDDQSIYGWRGAQVENIQRISKDYSGMETVRLEQNYRSTGTILAAANAVIANNGGRLGKNLWTDGDEGSLVQCYQAINETDEARFVAARIQQQVNSGGRYDDNAVLYRSNAQSRVLEEALISAAIPYRVHSGMRFFERAEIKDALAYLRLISNRNDDASFDRVVNTPTRGIGATSQLAVQQRARDEGLSYWQATRRLCDEGALTKRAANALSAFGEIIEHMAAAVADEPLPRQVEWVVEQSGLIGHYQKEGGEKARIRQENLRELVSAAGQFEEEVDTQELTPLEAFLSLAALESAAAESQQDSDCVPLMTLHAAKGLEFDNVFLCGLEEGLFPAKRSLEEPGRLEEERRLCYVGMTRARKLLHILYAEQRRLYGDVNYARASRFVGEIPRELTEDAGGRRQVVQPVFANTRRGSAGAEFSSQESDSEFALGERVAHPRFGTGVVTDYEGHGSQARVQVRFDAVGSKWLMLSYAKLEIA
ncbi:MAG: DNA helicase II, partial [Gammaproteobacteria bacterium]|nr:DNA helicase II [Gammaproteobacteria bacterium]